MAYKGRSFVLQTCTNATTPVCTTVGGLRTTKMTINNNPVDVSDDSSGWRQMLEDGGIQSVDITADGVTKSDTTLAALQVAAVARTPISCKLVAGNGDSITGTFVIASYERTGAHDGAETFTVQLQSTGTVTVTPTP